MVDAIKFELILVLTFDGSFCTLTLPLITSKEGGKKITLINSNGAYMYL